MGLLGKVGGQTLQWGANINQALGNQSAANNERAISSAMRDPNQVYTGSLNPVSVLNSAGDGRTQFAPVVRQASAPVHDNSSHDTDLTDPYQALLASQNASNAAQKEATLYGIDTGLNSANDGLGRLDSQAQTGENNINNDYNYNYQNLVGGQQKAQAKYEQGRNAQLNEYEAARTNNANQARSWLQSAQRTLGMQGAGDGSAARYNVPYDAQQQAATGNAGAQVTNNHNLLALASNWQDQQDQYTNGINDLNHQKETSLNDYHSKVANQRVQLMDTIANLMGQKTLVNGGNLQAAKAAANPYTSQIPGLLNNINSLAAVPALQAKQITTTAPTLAGYDFAKPAAPVTPQQDIGLSNPVLAALLGAGQPDQKQQPLYG